MKIYEDEDGARKEEIAALANKDNPFGAFYERLKEVCVLQRCNVCLKHSIGAQTAPGR